MKKKIFKSILFISIVIVVSGYSNNCNEKFYTECVAQKNSNLELFESSSESCNINTIKSQKSCEPCKTCCTEVPKTLEPCKSAYNGPARIDPACGLKAWVTGSFLYWQPREKGLDFGLNVKEDRSNDNNIENNKRISLDFDYHPGFKVGAGISMSRDDWTIYLEYTKFKTNHSTIYDLGNSFNIIDDATNSLISNWFNDEGPYVYLKLKWHLDYNMFDLDLGRPFYLGKKLIIKPHFGLRGGWINQKVNNLGGFFVNLGPETEHVRNNKSESWLIGPRVGLNTEWFLFGNFKAFGNVSGALTYQSFKTSLLESPAIPFNTSVSAKDKLKCINPNVEFGLGLGYGNYFGNNEWYYDLTIGYDFYCFWNQNIIRNFNEYTLIDAHKEACSDNLVLQGLTVTARLDF